jgi:hypothetical protein
MSRLTPAGLAFAKCVTSPNDFAVDSFQGIPDEYDGRVLAKRHVFTGVCPMPDATHDMYIVLAPIPGVAYMYGSRLAGTTGAIALNSVFYYDDLSLFPNNHETDIVTGFRFASNVVEIVPTVNAMTWGGAIEVWKASVELSASQSSATAQTLDIVGLTAIQTDRPQSVLPFNHGCYAPTSCMSNACDFTPVIMATAYTNLLTGASGVTFTTSINFTGLGKQETTFIKIPATAAANSALIRTWACVEYQVNQTSLLYEYARISASPDPLAMRLVKQYIQSSACAVPYYDNANFWQNFLVWARPFLTTTGRILGSAQRVANTINEELGTYL